MIFLYSYMYFNIIDINGCFFFPLFVSSSFLIFTFYLLEL
jgi:hypothetical protein